MNFLGIDSGTSGLKAVVVDAAQTVLAEAAVPLATSNPRPGWSEQDPDDWWEALRRAIRSLAASQPLALRAVRAIGLSGQMHGAVLLDAAGRPIRPAILWNDGRATRECEGLQAAVPDLPAIAGVIAMPGFTAPKLLWLRAHEPENFARIAKVVSPKDYLRLKLTGELATDMSDAAGTLWLDEAQRDWSDAILSASGLSRSHMPELMEGSAPGASLRAGLAREWGIDGPAVVAGGAGDTAAAGIGIGCVQAGDSFVHLGTSCQFFVADDRYSPRPEALLHAFAHAVPARWYRMAAMLNGASCLDWAGRLVGETDLSALLARTEAAFRGPSRQIVLPYFSGERTPHNDAFARGVVFGLDRNSGPLDLVQATLEGVAYSFMDAQRCLGSAGISPDRVAAVGGGARSRFWIQLIAHALGQPIVRYAGSEKGPAFGAARLARLAVSGETLADICTKPPVLDVVEPRPELHAAYAGRYERFRALYQALRPEFPPLARQEEEVPASA